MSTKLTIAQSDALRRSGESLPLVDPRTDNVYILIDQSVHEKAMEALQHRQLDDQSAIQQGIDDMEAGRGMTIEESRERTSANLSRLLQ